MESADFMGFVLVEKRLVSDMSDFLAVKLEIFIPCSYLDMLRETLHFAGAGTIGNYDSSLSYSLVKGCWRVLPGASPYDGEIGILKEADEYKVEVRCKIENLDGILKDILAMHPYETPVINVIPLLR